MRPHAFGAAPLARARCRRATLRRDTAPALVSAGSGHSGYCDSRVDFLQLDATPRARGVIRSSPSSCQVDQDRAMTMQQRSKPLRCAMAGVLGLLAWMGVASQACAASIYKCTDARGSPAYQDRPCAHGLQQSMVAIIPPPSSVTPVSYASSARSPAISPRVHRVAKAHVGRSGRSKRVREAMSWECRVANGEVFYRHGSCPKVVSGSSRASRKAHQRGRSRVGMLRVVGHRVARADACRMINETTVSDRFGHERDEQVSTYERNLGRDPCRRY